jgi:hypothetical protein
MGRTRDQGLSAHVDADGGAAPYSTDEDRRAEESFVRGVIARGEAAKAVDGKLPAGALFEIIEEAPGELPKIVRRRYSR